jgi:hypothetical protein
MVSNVNSGGNATQAVQQASTANRQAGQAEQAGKRQAEQAQLQADQARQADLARQEEQNRKPPTVNTQGQVTGSIVNTTA